MRYLGLYMRDDEGQDLPEYAMLIGLVGLAVIIGVGLLGDSISNVFDGIGSNLDSSGVGS